MSQNKISEPLSPILQQIELHLNKINNLYLQWSSFLQADISYYEKITKNLQNFSNIITKTMGSKYTNKPLFFQPVGLIFVSISQNFKDFQEKLTQTIIPSLRKFQQSLSSGQKEFLSFQKTQMNLLNKAIFSFYHDIQKIQNCQENEEGINLIGNILNSGPKIHSLYSNTIQSIISFKEAFTNQFHKTELQLKTVFNDENNTILQTNNIISQAFPFPQFQNAIIQSRLSPENETNQLGSMTLALILSLTQLPSPCPILQQSHFSEIPSSCELYGRIWEDYTPSEEKQSYEIEVKKKEIVRIKRADFSDFWNVERDDGVSGFIPNNIIELLKRN